MKNTSAIPEANSVFGTVKYLCLYVISDEPRDKKIGNNKIKTSNNNNKKMVLRKLLYFIS